MATNLDIIKRALKKISALAAGSEPPAVDAYDANEALKSIFVELIGNGTLGALNDVLATDDYTACEWDRIRADEGVTVTLPTEITTDYTRGPTGSPSDYGWGVSTTPRPPYNLAPVVVVDSDGEATYSLYNAYTGAWVAINDLGQQATFPLPKHLENGFACMLAEALVDEFGGQVGEQTKRQSAYCRVALTHRPDSQRRAAVVSYI
jgi:hypothetical protein